MNHFVRPGPSPAGRAKWGASTHATIAIGSDGGPGIPVQERVHLFERFRRGNAARASGSGLGLAIVAAAVRQMGARIEVGQGIDGRGVSFLIAWQPQTSMPG
ncbi:MAG: ATP-binding protein [Burkholderiales bacterium]